MAQTVAAVDFGTSKIAVVAGRVDLSGNCYVTGVGVAPYAGFRESEWLDWPSVHEALLQARREAQAKGSAAKDFFVSVPGEFLLTRLVHTEVDVAGTVRPEHVAALVQDSEAFYLPQGFVALHRTPIYYLLDGNNYTHAPVGAKGRVLEAWVSHVMADRAFIHTIDELMETLGLGIMGYIAGPVAVAHHVRLRGDNPRTAVVVDAGHYSSDVMVAEGDGIVFHANIPNGGVDLTNDIARIANVDFEQAEAMKRQSITQQSGVMADRGAMHSDLEAALQWRVESIAGKMNKALDDAGFRWDSVGSVYLTGQGLDSPRYATETLTAAFGKYIRHYVPAANVLVPQGAAAALAVLDYATYLEKKIAPQGFAALLRRVLKK